MSTKANIPSCQRCCMPGCKVNSKKCATFISFHSLPSRPKDARWRDQLVKIINRTDMKNMKKALICSIHFDENCIVTSKNILILFWIFTFVFSKYLSSLFVHITSKNTAIWIQIPFSFIIVYKYPWPTLVTI